ncbi:tetratricopeptide repeat protein [Chlamydiota bacterium]
MTRDYPFLNRTLFLLLCVLFSFSTVIIAEEIVLEDGEFFVYKEILQTDEEGITFITQTGITSIPWVNIPKDFRMKFNNTPHEKSGVNQQRINPQLPKNALYWYEKAYQIHKISPNKALHYSFLALKQNPSYTDALVLTGTIYEYLKNPHKSLSYFIKAKKSLDISNKTSINYVKILYTIGKLYHRLNDSKKSLDYLKKAQKIIIDLDKKELPLYEQITDTINSLTGILHEPKQKSGLYYKNTLTKKKARKRKGYLHRFGK